MLRNSSGHTNEAYRDVGDVSELVHGGSGTVVDHGPCSSRPLSAAVNFVSILRVQCVAALCWVRIANVVHAEKREYLWFLVVPD